LRKSAVKLIIFALLTRHLTHFSAFIRQYCPTKNHFATLFYKKYDFDLVTRLMFFTFVQIFLRYG